MNKLIIILFFLLSPFYIASAQTGASLLGDALIDNFGGRVVLSVPCTCTASYVIYVLDIRKIASIGNAANLLKIKSINDLKNLSSTQLSVFKKIMVFPFTFSRTNLFYTPLPGNSVLGTYISIEALKSKLGKVGLKNIGVGKDKYLSGCYQGFAGICVPTPNITVDGVLTPRPFSGMGTSFIPL